MIRIEPQTLHRSDDPRLSALSAALVGQRLASVRYAVPGGNSWVNYCGYEHLHEVDMGVEMVTDSGLVLEMSWAPPGGRQGLLLALDRADERPSSELVDLVDVSDLSQWLPFLSRLIEEVGISYHIHDIDSSVRPWAFRIGVSGGSSVTIALGEVDDDVLHYMPDNIVVIFDQVTAREYQIVDGLQSAWGELIR